MNRERLAILLAFVLIFAFNSIDNAIAPLVKEISRSFHVSDERALWLISSCTGGTVLGLIVGPAVLAANRTRTVLLSVLIAMGAAQVLFPLAPTFGLALVFRAVSGFAAGLIATVMWRLTYHGVSPENYPLMVAVLMSARPLATALGVPAAGLLAWQHDWQTPVWAIAGLTTVSGFLLYLAVPARIDDIPGERKGLVQPYLAALRVPYATPYYLGITVNRMAYFGFYAFCGLWFSEHYGLDLKRISMALLVIGLAEAVVNFSTGRILKLFGHRRTFVSTLVASGILLPLFLFGHLPLGAAVAVIAVFMLLDRIYSMALVMTIPQMFPSTGDKTTFGSLNTLTAWGAMMLISWFQGQFLGALGMRGIELVMIACFVVGSALLYHVQRRTVFP